MAEVDYRQEAAAQTAFAEAFRDDPDFVVPAVVAGTDRVLVSEWVDGHSAGAGRPQRRRSASASGRPCCWPGSCCRAHPGSGGCTATRIRATSGFSSDGRLAVLDFGSSLPMPRGWPPRLAALLRAGRDRDAAALFEVATATGLVARPTSPRRLFWTLLDPLLDPLRQESSPSTAAWLRAQTARVSDPRSAVARTQRKLRVPVRHLLVQRVAAGTAGVLCLLGATVPVADEVAAWMPELDSRS